MGGSGPSNTIVHVPPRRHATAPMSATSRCAASVRLRHQPSAREPITLLPSTNTMGGSMLIAHPAWPPTTGLWPFRGTRAMPNREVGLRQRSLPHAKRRRMSVRGTREGRSPDWQRRSCAIFLPVNHVLRPGGGHRNLATFLRGFVRHRIAGSRSTPRRRAHTVHRNFDTDLHRSTSDDRLWLQFACGMLTVEL